MHSGLESIVKSVVDPVSMHRSSKDHPRHGATQNLRERNTDARRYYQLEEYSRLTFLKKSGVSGNCVTISASRLAVSSISSK